MKHSYNNCIQHPFELLRDALCEIHRVHLRDYRFPKVKNEKKKTRRWNVVPFEIFDSKWKLGYAFFSSIFCWLSYFPCNCRRWKEKTIWFFFSLTYTSSVGNANAMCMEKKKKKKMKLFFGECVILFGCCYFFFLIFIRSFFPSRRIRTKHRKLLARQSGNGRWNGN